MTSFPDSHGPPASVVVTGASTGIGEAVTRRLAASGYRVIAGIRRPADGDRLRETSSDRVLPIQLDVTDRDQVDRLGGELAELTGGRGLAGLVNNAGIAIGGPIEYVPVDLVRRQFEVNVFGMLAVTQACLPHLRVARGRIVNIGSIAGIATSPMVAPYCMSKHAVEALTDGLRLELAPTGIQVSVVEPGPVRTAIWEKGVAQLAEAERLLPPIAIERYGRQLRFFEKVLQANNGRGVLPDQVADAVIDALESDQPKTRYLVGRDAKVRAFVARFLPDRLGDALIRAALGRMERTLA